MNNSAKFWDRAANTYDQSEKGAEETIIRIIEKTKMHLSKGFVVFDFGCGTGRITNEIAASVEMVQALDTSAQMIAIAREKVHERKIENINYAHATIFDESYAGGTFDAVLAFYVLHLLEDSHRVMQRINQLLKTGGLLISVTPCLGGKKALQGFLSLAGKIGLVPKIRAFKVSELEEKITRGGFEIVEEECLQQRTQEYFMVASKGFA